MTGPALRVLVADGDRDTVDATCLLLRVWGYEHLAAYTGVKALALAALHRPQVVLLDLAMPGWNGYQLARRLRDQPGMDNSLLIGVSDDPKDPARSRKAGCDRHFTKPFPPEELQRLLVEAAGLHTGSRTGLTG